MASKSGDLEKVSLAMNKVSIQVVEEEGDVKKKIDRHCAFCLTLVPGAEVKLCSKCKRRAYCSKECQTADWKSPKEKPVFNGKIRAYGQGHKNWCGLPYGEEDLDWKVAPISGKGLGLIALRDLPPLFRIMVEAMQASPPDPLDGYHPEINRLVHEVVVPGPSGSSAPLKKFDNLNGMRTVFGSKIGLRFARTGHNCDPNCFYVDEEDFLVLILCSSREIKEGEELCFDWIHLFDFPGRHPQFRKEPPEFFQNMLLNTWGVVCPSTCACKSSEKLKLLKICQKLYEECERDYGKKNVVFKMEKVLETAEKLGCLASTMSRLHNRASTFAKASLETKKAWEYFEKHLRLNQAVYHPQNQIVLDWENDFKDM